MSWDKEESWDSNKKESWDSKNSWETKDEKSDDKSDAWDKWGTKEEEKKDDWGSKDDWGAKASDAPQQPQARAFWDTQKWNKESGVLSKKEEWQLEADDNTLFQVRLGNNAGIDFEKYDSVPVDISGSKADLIPVCQSFEQIYKDFSDFVPEALMQNVRKCMYSKPTPVQKYAVPVGLVGRDVMCCAQTGSGKTAAFLIPIIGRMMKNNDNPIGSLDAPFDGECDPDTLILTPTRELCIQIYEEALKFCHRTAYRVTKLYGGAPTKEQLEDIALGADLMVACPGRLTDFMGRGVVRVDRVFVLVLDEADRMLDMGFEPQIREIIDKNGMPAKENRQTMMFSATFPEECQRMAQDYLYDYVWVGVGVVGGAVETVEQKLQKVTPQAKYEALFEVLDSFFSTRSPEERCLVFVNAKDTAKWLDEQLYEKNIDTGALHGNLDQTDREKNLNRFRSGEIDVMVATDVAARGLDIERVTLVVNYDMPNEIDSYIHRIGRTGRIGNKGTAITFISCDQWSDTPLEKLDVLQKLLRVMRDSSNEIPSWLENLIEQGEGSWKWGSSDTRGGEKWTSNGADDKAKWTDGSKDDKWANGGSKDDKEGDWSNWSNGKADSKW